MFGPGKHTAFLITGIFFCCISFSQQGETPLTAPQLQGNTSLANHESSSASLYKVRSITVKGNKKTRLPVIMREISFKEGEHYPLDVLVKKFEDAQRQLMNTVLFHEVQVTLKSLEGYNVDVLVTLIERWYLFPLPYFKYVDRNLNQWLFENDAKLNRVNYGIKVLYNNATGNNDKLNVWLINGYTRQVSVSYDRLYIDKKMKWGINGGVAMGKNREVNYTTINNKQLFYKDTNNYIRSFFKSNVELTYRRAIRTRHRFGIAYNEEQVDDTIIALNPTYFRKGRDRIRFPELYYVMNYYDVDYIPYPLEGYHAELSFHKKGFNKIIDVWQLTARGGGGWKIANKTYLGLRASGTIKFPFHQPYYNQRLLGYSDFFMQGYEYYVIDGVAGGYLKSTLTRQILNTSIKYRKRKEGSLNSIPIRIFAKIYGNAGYVHHPDPGANHLNNRMLFSGGLGLDLISIYDFTMRLEWSFNQLGQNGLFLHRKLIF